MTEIMLVTSGNVATCTSGIAELHREVLDPCLHLIPRLSFTPILPLAGFISLRTETESILQ